MKWIVGVAIWFVSLAMVYGMLPSSEPSGGTQRARGVFIASVLLGVAFFGLRLSAAQTYQHMLLAVSFAVMELGAVWLVERKISCRVLRHRDLARNKERADAG